MVKAKKLEDLLPLQSCCAYRQVPEGEPLAARYLRKDIGDEFRV